MSHPDPKSHDRSDRDYGTLPSKMKHKNVSKGPVSEEYLKRNKLGKYKHTALSRQIDELKERPGEAPLQKLKRLMK